MFDVFKSFSIDSSNRHCFRPFLLLTLLSLLGQLIVKPSSVRAQMLEWAMQAGNGPSPREGHSASYDSNRDTTVLFGGRNDGLYGNPETWEWNGTTWSLRTESGPSRRFQHSTAYDSLRGVTILFGGLNNGNYLGDTWEWNGVAWLQREITGPSPRAGHAMVYDSARGVSVLFGGNFDGSWGNSETWEWNGTLWSLRTESGPSPRYKHAMAYDSARNVTILFGGFHNGEYLGDTWEWNGITWTQHASTGPTPRGSHSMAYNPSLGKTLLFGGEANSIYRNETWAWDGTSWLNTGVFGPSPRSSQAMSYSSVQNTTLLFGGLDTSGVNGETWKLSNQRPQVCMTSTATLDGASLSQFGNSVSLSANGNFAAIGAWKENSLLGVARIYSRSGTSWLQQGSELVANGGVGAAQYFGTSACLNANGTTAVFGAYNDNNGIGAAYVFTRSGNTWAPQGAKLVPAGGSGSLQYFGTSSAISADGNTVVVGAWHDNNQVGAAYVFTRSGNVWVQQRRLVPPSGTGAGYFGNSVSLSADGNTCAIGAQLDSGGVGAVFVYTRSGGVWSQQGPRLMPIGNLGSGSFGNSVSISSDGNTLLIGSYSDNRDSNGNGIGAAYVFRRNGGSWTQQGPKIVPSIVRGRYFGFSVSLSGDASTAIVGMPGGDGGGGEVYVYIYHNEQWRERNALSASRGNFGNSTSLSNDGSLTAVGAWNESKLYFYSLTRTPSLIVQPASATVCQSSAAVFTVSVQGSASTYRWQRETALGSQNFVNLNNGSTASWDGQNGSAIVFGATTSTLIIAPDIANGRVLSQSHAISYRCVVTNTCDSTSSEPAILTICIGDFNCDGGIDGSDVEAFLTDWEAGNATADVNGDGGIDGSDVEVFFGRWEAGC